MTGRLPWPCPPHRFDPPVFGLVGRDDRRAADWCGYMPLGLVGGQVCAQLADHPVHHIGPDPARCALCGLPVRAGRGLLGDLFWTHLDVDESIRLVGNHAPRVGGSGAR